MDSAFYATMDGVRYNSVPCFVTFTVSSCGVSNFIQSYQEQSGNLAVASGTIQFGYQNATTSFRMFQTCTTRLKHVETSSMQGATCFRTLYNH